MAQSEWTAAFVQRLRQLGWAEGRNVAIEYRWAEGRSERLAELAAEFVQFKVDVVLTHSTPATLAAKHATSLIPIVFAAAGNPVGTGLVESLAQPGGNVTGLSLQQTDTVGKRVELLREIVPKLSTLAIINSSGNPGAVLEIEALHAAAQALSLTVTPIVLQREEDIVPAFETLKGRADALYVAAFPLVLTNIIRINTLALIARLPTIYVGKEYVQAGGLMSYGPNYPHLYRRAAEFVDKILRGTKPSEIPVEQPTKFDLVINLTTAKALGLTVPPTLLARADEVIE
jgi:putative ABC transport system substrate-binding protein